MKMDSKVAELTWEVEEEDREKKEAAQEEEAIRLQRKPSEMVFRERMFTEENVAKMTVMMGPALEPVIDKICGDCVKNSPEVKELLEFYKLGADEDNDDYGEEKEEGDGSDDDDEEDENSDSDAGGSSSDDDDDSDSDAPKKVKVRKSVVKKEKKSSKPKDK
jgi:ABC-type Zn2+ transport system substrate-binding protein/surface adhesin